jgi:hypothetical protein
MGIQKEILQPTLQTFFDMVFLWFCVAKGSIENV